LATLLGVTAGAGAAVAGTHAAAGRASTLPPGETAAHAAATTPRRQAARRTPVAKLIWGTVTLPNGKSAFPIYHQLGVNVFQIDLNWAGTAPTQPADPTNPADPAYQWPSDVAYAISQARIYGIKICLLVTQTPPWANGNLASEWAPDNPASYGDFLVAASREYPTVHLWMIWGEPNRNGNFEPMPSNSPVGPRRYALLLNSAYHALKSVTKRNIVIGGDTWSFGDVEPSYFVKWMKLPDGKAPPLDYYGHNPFSIRFPDLAEQPYYPGGRDIDDIDTLEAQLKGIYHRTVPLWLSEFTVSSDHNNRAFSFHVSRAAQARWLTAAFKLADSVTYTAGMGWFNLNDDPPSPTGLTQGLMTYSLQHKPAFSAYQHAP
jgi:hypothetical protein